MAGETQDGGVIGPPFLGSFSPVLALLMPLPCRCSGPCHLGQSRQLLAQRHSAGELIYIFIKKIPILIWKAGVKTSDSAFLSTAR